MKIAVLPGDGIGPEIMAEALKVLDYIIDDEGLDVEIESAPLGARAYFDYGDPFPDRTKLICDSADTILKGPVGLGHNETQKIPIGASPGAWRNTSSAQKIRYLCKLSAGKVESGNEAVFPSKEQVVRGGCRLRHRSRVGWRIVLWSEIARCES